MFDNSIFYGKTIFSDKEVFRFKADSQKYMKYYVYPLVSYYYNYEK